MHQRLLLAMLLSLLGLRATAEPLAVGAPAPAVAALTHSGDKLDLTTLYAKGPVLVFFYPRADTPGCTVQACSLRDAYEELTARGVTVVGVSTDSVAAQKAFREKHQLPFILLADPDRTVIAAFGVPVREVPVAGAFAARQAFLIKDGRILWRDLQAKTKEQAADVLAVLAPPGK